MTVAVTLSSLCRVLSLYNAADFSAIEAEYHTTPWLWENLSLGQKLCSLLGLSRFRWARSYIFIEPLVTAARPYLEKYFDGSWRRQDEDRLIFVTSSVKKILENDSSQKKAKKIVPQNLQLLLTHPPFRFADEKERAFKFLTELHKIPSSEISSMVAWHHNELFSQYRARITTLLSQQSVGAIVKKPAAPLVEEDLPRQERDALHEQYIRQALALEELLRAFIERASRIRHTIQKTLRPNILRMGVEIGAHLSAMHRLEQKILDSIVAADELAESLLARSASHSLTMPDIEQLFLSLNNAQASVTAFEHALRTTELEVAEVSSSVDHFWRVFDKKMQAFFKELDEQLILPTKSPLRQQQLKVIKSAREKLKQYRASAQATSGLPRSLADIEQEIHVFCALTQQFYDEGSEIEHMREALYTVKQHLFATEQSHLSCFSRLERACSTALELLPDRKKWIKNLFHHILEETSKEVVSPISALLTSQPWGDPDITLHARHEQTPANVKNFF